MRKQNLSNKLADARQRSGKSRADVSAETGVPVGTIYNWETRCLPSSWSAFALVAEAVDLKITDVFPA